MAEGNDQRCTAITRGGKRCGGTPVPGDSRCPWHAPAWAERRREWSRKGGRGKSNASRARKALPEAMTLGEARGVLSVAMRATLAGRLAPGAGSAVAALARALAALTEAADLEKRIAQLEVAARSDRWRSGA